MTHRSCKDKPYIGYIENGEILIAPNVYSARSLIPARFGDILVPVLNAGEESQILPKGTELGILQEVESVEEAEWPRRVNRITSEVPSTLQQEVIELSLIHI